MGESKKGKRSFVKAFAIGYLVWHAFVTFVTVVALGYVTYALVANVGDVRIPASVPVLGLSVSTLLLICIAWVICLAVALAGFAFALGSLGVLRVERSRLVLLGRVMLCLCIVDVAFGFIQANAVTVVSSIAAAILSAALLNEAEPKRGENKPEAEEEADWEPNADDHEGLHLFRMCDGYALIMTVWGALRILSGMATIFGGGLSLGDEATLQRLVSGVLACIVGGYLLTIGRFGKMSLRNVSKLKTFWMLSVVGMVLSVPGVISVVFWFFRGAGVSRGDIYCSLLDFCLCAAGFFYAKKLSELSKR